MVRVGLIGIACAGLGVGLCACENGSTGARSNSKSVFSMLDTVPSPAQASLWAVDPYDADKRQRGILLLSNAPFGGEPVYVDLYEAALQDPDAGVRMSAIHGIAMHGNPAQVPLLVPFLKDPDYLVRWTTARALQRLHNPVAVKPLIDRLDSGVETEYDVRASVATALGQYAERRVVQALIASLRDPSLLVTHASSKSLHTLTGQDIGDNPRVWTKWLGETETPFANRLAYEYPVFERDKRWYEWLVPFYEPPNEKPGAPVGMASATSAESARTDEKTESTPENSRSQ